MGGTLELIQSFNDPEIIDASDSSVEKLQFTFLDDLLSSDLNTI